MPGVAIWYTWGTHERMQAHLVHFPVHYDHENIEVHEHEKSQTLPITIKFIFFVAIGIITSCLDQEIR